MNIEQRKVTVGEIYDGFFDDGEAGVVGYDERLDIRPPYQREFVYNEEQQKEVIRTINKGLPLNVIYWVKTGEDSYEVLDGQQRTLSFCNYIDALFSVDDMYFHNLREDKQKKILDYELFVYVCDGTDSEKLEWFKIINIAGEKLTDQELRNAVYAGSWTASAKKYFSKSSGSAYKLASDYLKGTPIRQDYLETALNWIVNKQQLSTIEEYMALHQNDATAVELWNYFRSVIDWVQATFVVYRKEMKGLPWGLFYNEHHGRTDLNPQEIEKQVQELMADEEVQKKSGIYQYVLTGDSKVLNLRQFDKRIIREKYEQQNHRCAICGKECEQKDMQADHIQPWSKGGLTVAENCQMLCVECNLKKSNH